MSQNRIAIIGAGPVGLTLGLLLKKFKVPFTLIERKSTLGSHPSAHYINLRSMEIFSELYDIDQKIYSASEPIEHFRHFKYIRRLFERDNLYGLTDQFAPSIEEKRREIDNYSYKFPAHLAQHRLANILNQELTSRMDSNDNLLINTEFVGFQEGSLGQKRLVLKDRGTNKVQDEDFSLIVGCDGFRSTVRSALNIGVIGDLKLQKFLNIFFKSPKLGEMMLNKKENAMLHFIYNSKALAVLVNHSYKEGEFVLQVPISLDSQDMNSFTEEKCFEIINNCIDPNFQLQRRDIVIADIGFWNLSGVIAERYFQNNVILCGDAAHSFPPAGGFGMNTGIQDAYNLAFKIAYLHKHKTEQEEQKKVLDQYSRERRSHAHLNLSTAMRYYKNSVNIASYLGLRKTNLDLFEGVLNSVNSFLPSGARPQIFELGKTIGSYHLEMTQPTKYQNTIGAHENYKIPLIFLKEETQWKYFDSKEQLKDPNNITGLLCPHIYLQNSEGGVFSLRKLPEILYQRNLKEKTENPENFYIVLIFNEEVEKAIRTKAEEIVASQNVKGKIIEILVKDSNQGEASKTKSKNILLCNDFGNLLEKFRSTRENIVVIRSDATVIARV